MGEVYLARDTKLRRSVALKVLSPELRTNEEWLRRFESEAYAASSLNHPNILTVYEIGSENDMEFIATEYIDGESLRQHLTQQPIQFRQLLDVAIQVASALAAAHSAGIVHRDIKPENIMLRRDHVVKVLDFGLAKVVKQQILSEDEPTRAMHNTARGVVLGTASYMSPEQSRGVDIDERSDIWSLGVVLYEMATGKLPFSGDTTSDVIASILIKEPLPLHNLHPEFDRIVTKSLRKDRDERYQVVKDLLLDLKSLKQKVELETELERTGSADKQRTGQRTGPANNPTDHQTENITTTDLSPGTSPVRTHPTSSAEYIANEIKQHKGGVVALVVAVLVAALAAGYFFFNKRATTTSASTGVASIAVLPFENADNDPNAEYLSDGISESVINALSQLPHVKVIARSSSFQYRGKSANLQEVAKSLGVDSVLTGRVTHLGDDLLISAELVNASDRTQIWGEQFNRKISDVVRLPAEISGEIAQKLRLRLTPIDQQRLARGGTKNPEAYELLLKASYASVKGDVENLKKANEYLKQAIQLDPKCAIAYAGLAVTYNDMIQQNLVSADEFKPRAAEAARKAIELDDNEPQSHYAMAYVKTFAWEWAAAEQELKRSIELNPNMAGAHYGYSIFLGMVKRHDEAIREAKLTRELDPISPFSTANLGSTYLIAGKTEEAIATLQKLLELDKSFPYVHLYLAYAYAANAQYREAIASYQEAAKLGGDYPGLQASLGVAYAKAGDREKALAILNKLQTTKEPVSPTDIANLLASLGQMDQAYAMLDKAYNAHDSQLPSIASDPMYMSLRGDARYADVVKKVGLTP